MKKAIIDIFFSLLFNTLLFFCWIYKVIITSDIPISFTINEFFIVNISLLLLSLIYFLYCKFYKTNKNYLNLFLLSLNLILWTLGLLQSTSMAVFNTLNFIMNLLGVLLISIMLINLLIITYKKTYK